MGAESNLSTTNQSLHGGRYRFGENFRRGVRESIRHYGWWRTGGELSVALYRLVRELLPDRRRIKYGDLDYDWDHSVDTTRANVGFKTQFMAALTGHQYFATEPWLFEQIMGALPLTSCDFTFIDLGSGKGRTLLMASEHRFKRIAGVEFIPELNAIAQRNIARYSSETQQCRDIESICLDARDFRFPTEPLVVYMFNPFPEPAFAAVLEELRRSFQERPRPVFVAYRYAELESLLAASDWLIKVAGTGQWVLYRNRERKI